MSERIGPVLGIDGEAEFRKQLRGIVQQSKELASEMKMVASAFDKSDRSQKAVTAQIQTLTKQIDTQKGKVSLWGKGVQEASKVLDTLQKELQEAKNKYSENSKEVEKATKAYEQQKKAVSNAKIEYNNAVGALNKMQREVENLEKSIDDVGDAMEDASGKTVSFGEILKGNLVSQAIVGAVKEVGSTIKDMAGDFVEAAASTKAQSSQFQQTFREFKNEATDAIKSVADTAGILDTRLNASATQIYAFAKASGGDAAESMDLMKRSLQAATDSAAYYDKGLEETVGTLQSFLKGNYENDAALGLSATEATRNAEAMEQFGKKFNDLTEIQKQQTLLQMVLDAQELSGAMGQASREADGWENVQGNLNESWKQFIAKVGTPILENLTPIIQEVTKKLVEMTENIDWDAFNDSVNNFVTFMKENGPQIISTIAGIGTAFLAWKTTIGIQGIISETTSKISEMGGVISALKKGFSGITTFLKANPAAIIITAIVGITTVLVTLWHTNEDFRNAVKVIWENIKQVFSQAWEGIKAVWDTVKPYFEQVWNQIKDVFQSAIDAIKAILEFLAQIGKIVADNIMGAFKIAWEVIRDVWTACEPFFRTIWNIISAIFSHAPEVFGSYFRLAWELIKGVWNTATGFFKMIFDSIAGIFSAISSVLRGDFEGAWEAIKGAFDSWEDFFTGLVQSLFNIFGAIGEYFLNIGKSIVNGIRDGIAASWEDLKNWWNNLWEGTFGRKTINVDINTTETRTVKTVHQSGGKNPSTRTIEQKFIQPRAFFALPQFDASALKQAFKEQVSISGYSENIGTEVQRNYWKVQHAMDNAANSIPQRSSAAPTSTKSNNVNMGGIHITVNPAPGMDENALAYRVAQLIGSMTQSKGEVWE